MPASAPPDHARQLRDAVQTARDAILAGRAAADGTSEAARGALDVARRTFAEARTALADAQANVAVASYLDRKLVDANLTALRAARLADGAESRAEAATAAIAAAAGAIKAASEAVGVVTRDVNGIAGITRSNDQDEPVDEAAKAAVRAVGKAALAVERLKSLALGANIEAARPRSSAALQAAQSSQSGIAAILETADRALQAGNAAVAAAQSARSADLEDLFAKSTQFAIASRDDDALGLAVTVVDRVGNASLRVSVHNDGATKDEPEGPGLHAACDLAPETAAATREVRFFAVPASEAASFDFEAAHKSRHYAKFEMDENPVPPRRESKIACAAVVRRDSENHPLQYGHSYSVFFLRIPRQGSARGSDFSFAAPPFTSSMLLGFTERPAVFPLAHGAFVAAFPGAEPEEGIGSYQLFFAPAGNYEKAHGAWQAGTLDVASFTTLEAGSQACDPSAGTVPAVRQEFIRELRAFGPIPRGLGEGLDGALKPLEKWIASRRSSYVAYLSPFASSTGWRKEGAFAVARYTDMYGDYFDLWRESYRAVVLAVTSVDQKRLRQAANILSPASAPFPPPAEETAPRKPATE
jgi:hypothetical protein